MLVQITHPKPCSWVKGLLDHQVDLKMESRPGNDLQTDLVQIPALPLIALQAPSEPLFCHPKMGGLIVPTS